LSAMIYFLNQKPPPEPFVAPDYCQVYVTAELKATVIMVSVFL